MRTSDEQWIETDLIKAFGKRANYHRAKVGIENGTMHSINAVALLATDPDVIAQADLNGWDRYDAARALLEKWRRDIFSA